jgi:hypothetical protein
VLVKSAVLTMQPQDEQMIAYIRNRAPLTVSSLSSKKVDVHLGHVGKAIVFNVVGVISGREVLPEKRGESLVDQGFSPGRVRGSGGWRGWRQYGEGDCIPFA